MFRPDTGEALAVRAPLPRFVSGCGPFVMNFGSERARTGFSLLVRLFDLKFPKELL